MQLPAWMKPVCAYIDVHIGFWKSTANIIFQIRSNVSDALTKINQNSLIAWSYNYNAD